MSMWPENVGIKEQKQAKMENFDKDHQDPLEDVKFDEKPVSVDFQRLVEMAESGKGQSHMRWFMKQWERKRASALQALEEDLDPLCQERKDDQEPMKDAEHESISYWKERAMQLEERIYQEHGIDVECDISSFWKERVMRLEEKLQACLQKKHALVEKPEGSIRNPPSHTLKDKFSGLLRRADFFLHLVLQSAPVIIAHQDAELRYRFIFNHYPTLGDDEDVIGKTDYEILSGEGAEEMNSVKREVMATGIATKREFTFNTPMFGEKTFLMYIEPVFSKAGETVGVNHVAMDITDQVKRRKKMADIRVREAIQKAMESELVEAMKNHEP